VEEKDRQRCRWKNKTSSKSVLESFDLNTTSAFTLYRCDHVADCCVNDHWLSISIKVHFLTSSASVCDIQSVGAGEQDSDVDRTIFVH
jgi:hypothetical protein